MPLSISNVFEHVKYFFYIFTFLIFAAGKTLERRVACVGTWLTPVVSDYLSWFPTLSRHRKPCVLVTLLDGITCGRTSEKAILDSDQQNSLRPKCSCPTKSWDSGCVQCNCFYIHCKLQKASCEALWQTSREFACAGLPRQQHFVTDAFGESCISLLLWSCPVDVTPMYL